MTSARLRTDFGDFTQGQFGFFGVVVYTLCTRRA